MINATQAIIALLNTNEAFRQLKYSEIQSIKKSHEVINYARGASIFLEGEKPESLLCLIEGKVKIYQEALVVANRYLEWLNHKVL